MAVFVVACGPSTRANDGTDGGSANAACATPGATQSCYDGASGTSGVGPCHGGTQTCQPTGTWGTCDGEVVPVPETCGDGVDNNCNGMTDEDVDADGDGWTSCGGDCCDDPSLCSNPSQVNPGAYDVPGDGIDNDCDGSADNAVTVCDQSVSGQSTTGLDYAKAIDICQTTTMADPMRRWGVIDATFSLTSGTGSVVKGQHAILKKYGTGVTPHNGDALALFSNGVAAGKGDPGFDAGLSTDNGTSSAFPADFLAANGGKLPNAPNCPAPNGTKANDPIMLTLHVRVPTNAGSFSVDTNFFSSEFPEYTCSPFNDFFVILLDSMYAGTPANPTDKNLAFYTDAAGMKYPVGVNLAAGNTGLFTECKETKVGCAVDPFDSTQSAIPGPINTCTSVTELAGTGMDAADPEQELEGAWGGGGCDASSLIGGATGWLTTSGNVKPGEIMTLRIALWDTSDGNLDSLAVIDNFKWSAEASNPGTVINIARNQEHSQPGADAVVLSNASLAQ